LLFITKTRITFGRILSSRRCGRKAERQAWRRSGRVKSLGGETNAHRRSLFSPRGRVRGMAREFGANQSLFCLPRHTRAPTAAGENHPFLVPLPHGETGKEWPAANNLAHDARPGKASALHGNCDFHWHFPEFARGARQSRGPRQRQTMRRAEGRAINCSTPHTPSFSSPGARTAAPQPWDVYLERYKRRQKHTPDNPRYIKGLRSRMDWSACEIQGGPRRAVTTPHTFSPPNIALESTSAS